MVNFTMIRSVNSLIKKWSPGNSTFEHVLLALSMENIFHLSLDLLGLSTVPGLEVGGYLDSMLNSVPPFYYLTLATSFLIDGLSICFKMERDR